MTFLQIGVPLGIVVGYVLTSLIKGSIGWYYAFIIQSIITFVLLIISAFIPLQYFSSTHRPRKSAKDLSGKHLQQIQVHEDYGRKSMDTLYEDQDDELNKNTNMNSFCLKFKKMLSYKVTFFLLNRFLFFLILQ